ncbi:MAG: cyclophilin-like fold protein [Bacteroides sp.]|nr:cyclophilin-like fold protein [Eubacterium sp.]MCM1417669.1 cyclophilin-like fold protein [Roseburia sp.]MCM1461865.1 cyclophilin-like fold protein [Bacteroides sp.]
MTNGPSKKIIDIILTAIVVILSGCQGRSDEGDAQGAAYITTAESFAEWVQTNLEPLSGSDADRPAQAEAEPIEDKEDEAVNTNEISIVIGENTLTATLEDNESAAALRELLSEGALTLSASNYGGFEKVCPLGTSLPRNDRQTTTRAGDICLYNGNQIVLFYGSNAWSYTPLGKITGADSAELERVLSGEETELTLSLGAR